MRFLTDFVRLTAELPEVRSWLRRRPRRAAGLSSLERRDVSLPGNEPSPPPVSPDAPKFDC